MGLLAGNRLLFIPLPSHVFFRFSFPNYLIIIIARRRQLLIQAGIRKSIITMVFE
jgi:hypothetical protein